VAFTLQLFDYAIKHQIPVKFASSASVYGNTNGQINPLNYYAITKLQIDYFIQDNLDKFSSLQSFRYFNVYGPREPLKGEYAPVMGLFKRQKEAGQPMTIVGNGNQRRDFTHISDAVEANLLAAEKLHVTGPVNIGTGRNYSINELAVMIGGDRLYVAERVGETRETLANNMRAREELSWTPKVNLEDYLRQ
jgi:nucleoside-diphosphate-sugar epimerase